MCTTVRTSLLYPRHAYEDYSVYHVLRYTKKEVSWLAPLYIRMLIQKNGDGVEQLYDIIDIM